MDAPPESPETRRMLSVALDAPEFPTEPHRDTLQRQISNVAGVSRSESSEPDPIRQLGQSASFPATDSVTGELVMMVNALIRLANLCDP